MARALALLLLAGCALPPLLTSSRLAKTNEPIVAAAEDGSQYVRVDGGVLSTEAGLVREWKRTADKACDGEHMVLSDASFERKKAGIVVSRTHEGYVRCIVGDPDPSPSKRDSPPPQRIGSRR
jgi:hypothetical protein